jgi:hypothetical protein
MSQPDHLQRREVIAGLASIGAALTASSAGAQPGATAHAGHAGHDAPPPAPRSPQLKAVIQSIDECLLAGRVCLVRCTDHLASGMSDMAACQRAVMNMLSVSAAMADVAGFANAATDDIRALAGTCARFCDTCARPASPMRPATRSAAPAATPASSALRSAGIWRPKRKCRV